MLGFTSNELPFLGNLKSNWVVIIGLELLSLTLVTVMVMLILLVWRLGFGVTEMEFIGVMPMVQGFVRCDAGSQWIVIIPKSKDQFME
jgi:hypothetical protein